MRRVTTCGDKDSDGHQGRQGLDSGLQVPPALCVLGDLRCHQPSLLGTSGVTNPTFGDLRCHQLPSFKTSSATTHPWGPQVSPTPSLGTSGATNPTFGDLGCHQLSLLRTSSVTTPLLQQLH